MQHHFDVRIAEQYGILEAILLNHFEFWVAKNEANESNYYDGDYWTYNSTRALQMLFPYVSQRKIQNALKHLIDEGLLKTGNYNKSAYDRTLWYTFTQKGKCIMQKCEMEDAKSSNQLCENVTPIPDNNTDNITDNINKGEQKELNATVVMVINHLNEVCGTNYKANNKETKKHVNARLQDGFVLEDFFTVIDKKASEWIGTEFEKFLRPKTLFGTKFENYLNQRMTQKSNNPFYDMLERSAQ